MFEPMKLQNTADAAPAFIAADEAHGLRPNLWAEAGHAIEAAYREPDSIGQAVRVAVAIALVVGAKLCAAAMLG